MFKLSKQDLLFIIIFSIVFTLLQSLFNWVFAAQVKIIDVGQGDSILIQTSTENILIDTGDASNRQKLLNALESNDVYTIHKLILTHPHADHIANAATLIKQKRVIAVYDNGFPSTSSYYRSYLNAIKNSTTTRQSLRAGDVLDFGDGVTFNVLNPDLPFDKVNDNSITGKIIDGDFSILLTGDIELDAETYLTDFDIAADILKACHHGSKTSNSLDFVNNVKPQCVVISAGLNNKFGHPHSVALDNFIIAGVNRYNIFNTAYNGTITIDTANKTVTPDIATNWIDDYLNYQLVIRHIL